MPKLAPPLMPAVSRPNLNQNSIPIVKQNNSQKIADEKFLRAERAFAEKDYAAAVPIYNELLEAGISPGSMLYRLGMIANEFGQFESAYSFHCKAIAVEPNLARRITPAEYRHHHVFCRSKYEEEYVAACPVCESENHAPMQVINCLPLASYHPAYHPIRRWSQCGDCGHGFSNPRPTPAAMDEAASDPPPAHLTQFSYDQMTVKSDILHDLWTRKPGGTLLDVGTANGTTASVALDFGFSVVGVDIHSGYAKQVAAMGVEFVEADISTANLGGRTFDVILMGDVIEHVVGAKSTIENVKRLLNPGGLLWLSTPNYEGAWTRAMKTADAMWMEGEHIHYFSLRSLKRLLSDCGLNVIDYRLSKRYVGCAEIIAESRE